MAEIRALTSLRGVAAVWVFLFHLELMRPVFPAVLRQVLAIGRGYIAVDLFFALSGFVLALNYRDSFVTQPLRAAYPDFLMRRVARVMPLNAVIVAIIAVAVWLAPGSAGDNFAVARGPGAVIANLLLVQDWGLAPSINKPAWSVSVEMAVYLAFPLLLALAWSRLLWIVAAVAGIGALWWVEWTGQGLISRGTVAGDLIRGFAGFTFGLLCFRAIAGKLVPPTIGRFDLGILAAFWAALLFAPGDLMPVLLCPAVVLSLALARGPAARLFALKPLHYLGEISYSVYLVHYCVLGCLNLLAIRSAGLYAAAALVLTLAISATTYRFIERPARRWIARNHRAEKRSAFRHSVAG
jgi:peptidoglycan/LPS O-acetylase OafA/YrhL